MYAEIYENTFRKCSSHFSETLILIGEKNFWLEMILDNLLIRCQDFCVEDKNKIKSNKIKGNIQTFIALK